MVFHENRLLADDSHVISYLIFVENMERCRKICQLLHLMVKNIYGTSREMTASLITPNFIFILILIYGFTVTTLIILNIVKHYQNKGKF